MKFTRKIFNTTSQNDSSKTSNKSIKLSENLTENIENIKNALGNSYDFSSKLFSLHRKKYPTYAILFMQGITDKTIINSLTLEISMFDKLLNHNENNTSLESFDIFKELPLGGRTITYIFDYTTLYNKILSGHTIILVDGCSQGMAINTSGTVERAINEPTSQTVVRGPKEGFTENICVNISLIRKRIREKELRVDNRVIGKVTHTNVALMYIKGYVKEDILKELKHRLSKINLDAVLESGYIEELIKDNPYSIFPTIYNTERPDSVAAALLEGRIAILVDGTPFVLIVPSLFISFFQASEDYYNNFYIASFGRIIRFTAFLLTMLTPSLFIALTTIHQEMIPTPLLISISSQREGLPFPTLFEALMMEFTFEILREAGIRMPRTVGPAISIVGALVIGQAAVEAGIVSAAMVIIVSITAISSFAFPSYTMGNAVRIIRFILMILSAAFGVYGILLGIIVLVHHLCHLKSIGIPYMAPMAPYIRGENKDGLLKFPIWRMKFCPSIIEEKHPVRTRNTKPINRK